MWLSKRGEAALPDEYAGPGVVSIGGETPAIVSDLERRNAKLYSPGGYCWRPAADDKVLVIKSDTPCIAGKEQQMPEEIKEAEVFLYSKNTSIHLKNDGSIHLTGQVYVNGQLLGGSNG